MLEQHPFIFNKFFDLVMDPYGVLAIIIELKILQMWVLLSQKNRVMEVAPQKIIHIEGVSGIGFCKLHLLKVL